MCMYVCMYVCIYIYVCVCVCVFRRYYNQYMYIHTRYNMTPTISVYYISLSMQLAPFRVDKSRFWRRYLSQSLDLWLCISKTHPTR